MPELLLEVGVEELPAPMVESAATQLLALVKQALNEDRLCSTDTDEGVWYATPRRLIVSFPAVLPAQPGRDVERRGPSAKAAFGEDGSPTPALAGFCRSLGVETSQAVIRDDYIWVSFTETGRPAAEVLAVSLPTAIKSVTFEKTMRWGEGRLRFSRPIRWLLALLDGAIIPFAIEGVHSAAASRGHRFLSPDEFKVRSLESLLTGLQERNVQADQSLRASIIRDGAEKIAVGTPILSEELVVENVYLTEWPMPVSGHFRDEFLTLPKTVLVTAMAKHEKFFPVEDSDRNITSEFISVTNCGDADQVRQGNEWVLNARFSDAKFFYDEDKRHSLNDFLEKTERILFSEKLGTMRQRADRLGELAAAIAAPVLEPSETELCRQAGRLCKADLSTGLVSELPALQGKIGAEYAKGEGYPDEVCWALFSHYDPDRHPKCPGARVALVTMCADQADRLAGFLGIDETPTGSSDPYALRKATTMLIEAQLGWQTNESISDWTTSAARLYRGQGFALDDDEVITKRLAEILQSRYEALFGEVPYDAREAAGATNWLDNSRTFLERARTIAALSDDVAFIRTAKRPGNIVQSAIKNESSLDILQDVSEDVFETDIETRLLQAIHGLHDRAHELAQQERFEALAQELRALQPPISEFFDEVMVMVEDEKLRHNRLRLLARADTLYRLIGDFSKVVVEGE